VDYWAVDFDYMNHKEIIKVPRDMGIEGHLPGIDLVQGSLIEYEERWTGGYLFENEWQSFRTRQDRKLDLKPPRTPTRAPGITRWPSR